MTAESQIAKNILEELDVMEKEVEQFQLETLNLCRHLLENDPTKEEIQSVRAMIDRIKAFKEMESKVSIWKRSLF